MRADEPDEFDVLIIADNYNFEFVPLTYNKTWVVFF
jgi:hypothetical protein